MTKDKTAVESVPTNANKNKSTKGLMRDKSQGRTRRKKYFKDGLNKPTAKQKEQIIPNVGKNTSNRYASLNPPSPNGKVARQIVTGDDQSTKVTTSTCERKTTPNSEAMDLEDYLISKTTIIQKKERKQGKNAKQRGKDNKEVK